MTQLRDGQCQTRDSGLIYKFSGLITINCQCIRRHGRQDALVEKNATLHTSCGG